MLDDLDAIHRGDHASAVEAFAEDATWTTLPWPGVFRSQAVREYIDSLYLEQQMLS